MQNYNYYKITSENYVYIGKTKKDITIRFMQHVNNYTLYKKNPFGSVNFTSSFLLFSSTPIYAQPPTVPLQSEPGDRTYTRNLFSGVFAFVSSVGILVLICMPSRKNS